VENYETLAPSRVEETSATPAPPPPSTMIALPSGQVSDVVVGRWVGGEGDASDEVLAIGLDGTYVRADINGVPYREGVLVMSDDAFVAYDVDGQQESGSWTYTNSAGIEVLGMYFGPHYYSYVRS
jgi:hypothetical protein